jgi:NAD(P)H-flavin reductase
MATANTNSLAGILPDGHPMLARPFQVRRVVRETHDTLSLELVPPNGDSGFPFVPGQFNMLYAYGVGEAPISISGDPTRNETLVHTIRAVGAVTKALTSLKAGDSLGVRGPFGKGWPVDTATGKDVVIVTGGIGLAPLRPVIYYLLAHREEYGKIALLYGARTPEDLLYRKNLEKWRSRFDIETFVTVDRASTAWKGNVGVVTQLIHRALFDPPTCISLVCGPEIMMRYTIMEFIKRGVEEDRIFVSMERNMKCGIGLCGHCQIGPTFVCKDGPVYCYEYIRDILRKREM